MWLSRGKFLQKYRDLLPEIKVFWASNDWLLDLVFLVDITGMLNELIDLIGIDKTIVDTDFDRRFQDIAAMGPVAGYTCFFFGKDTDVKYIAFRMATLFIMDS